MDTFNFSTSATNCCTMFQLKSLIRRKNVYPKVSTCYHATADFTDMLLDCYIILAAMKRLSLETMEDTPEDMLQVPENERDEWFNKIVRELVL